MNRLWLVIGFLGLCMILTGCGSDTREGLISDTINMVNQAGTEIDVVQKAVDSAMKESKTKGTKLNLAAAIKAADKLKQTGDNTLQIKARIDMVKSQLTPEDQQANADKMGGEITGALKNLETKQNALRKTMAEAEKLDVPDAKRAVEELRKKLTIAESPFEALAR